MSGRIEHQPRQETSRIWRETIWRSMPAIHDRVSAGEARGSSVTFLAEPTHLKTAGILSERKTKRMHPLDNSPLWLHLLHLGHLDQFPAFVSSWAILGDCPTNTAGWTVPFFTFGESSAVHSLSHTWVGIIGFITSKGSRQEMKRCQGQNPPSGYW